MSNGNFKFRALKTYQTWITKGKIYEVKNGLLKWEDEMTNEDIEDFNSFIATYLEVKEYVEEVKDTKKEEIIIYRKDNEVVAIKKEDGKVVKSTSAKRHPEDEFNFNEGAKIAFARLTGDKVKTDEKSKIEEPCLRLINETSYKNYGKVGTPTKLKDLENKSLFVGDKILLISDDYYVESIIIRNEDEDFIMGLGSTLDDDWKMIKLEDYNKRVKNDIIHGVKCILK